MGKTILKNTVYSNNPIIETVNLNNVEFIANSASDAFRNCINLRSVTNINQNITNMSNIFYNCKNITIIPNIPANVTDISYGYYFCNKLTITPNLPENITNIANTFKDCRNLTTFPNITNLNIEVEGLVGTFRNCYAMSGTINLPQSITNLYTTFENCYNLNNTPVIPASVNNMVKTFSGCNNITNMPIIPANVTNLYMTFSNCTNLKNISDIPELVTNMTSTFEECTNLETAPTIPNSVTDLDYTFYNCSNLSGNIFINSININTAINCFNQTTEVKKVYIPFKSNNNYTTTYNSFINANYDMIGTKDNVYLKDINNEYYTVIITPNPSDATVIINGEERNFFTTEVNTEITYSVSKNGYATISDSFTLFADVNLNIVLTPTYKLTIEPYPSDATVTLATGRNYNIIGDVKIANEIAKNFSLTNYLSINEIIFNNSVETWELGGSFITYNLNSEHRQQYFFGTPNITGEYCFLIGLQDNNIEAHLSSNGINYNIGMISSSRIEERITANTKYYFKLNFNGTEYTLQISIDNINWITVGTPISTSTKVYNSSECFIGHWIGGIQYLDGETDLKDYYFKKNGQIVWKAVDTVLTAKDITVLPGTEVTYTVSKPNYVTQTNTITVNNTQTIQVNLDLDLVTLIIDPSVDTADINLVAAGYIQDTDRITVLRGTSVTYTVSAFSYATVTDTVVVNNNQTIHVELVHNLFKVLVEPTPSTANVILTATGYNQVDNYIYVPDNTTVGIEVSNPGYINVNTIATVDGLDLTIPIVLQQITSYVTVDNYTYNGDESEIEITKYTGSETDIIAPHLESD